MKVNKRYEQLNNIGNIHRMSTEKQDICIALSQRLKEERLKVMQTQEEIARLCGLTSRTWGTYERAVAVPDSFVLVKLAQLGWDVHYILTGERTPIIASTEEEQKIISQYRKANEPIKFAIRNIFEAVGL